MNDWNYEGNNYDRQVLVRETPHGIFRAVLEHDDHAEAPYLDFGCPVFELDRWGGIPSDTPRYGAESDKASGIDFPEAFDHFRDQTTRNRDALDLLDRWLRIFHGGSLTILSSTVHQSGPEYVVYDTRAMRESWGQTGEALETSAPEAGEWQAFIDSDVWGVGAERACAFTEDGEPSEWEETDHMVFGHYGEEWARQAGVEALNYTIEHAGSEMLPLDGAA